MIGQLYSPLLRGALTLVQVANPAAGAMFQWPVPSNFNIELQFIRFLFTTDANVANRNVAFNIQSPAGTVMYRSAHPIVHVASTGLIYYASQGSQTNLIIGGNALPLIIPPNLILTQLWTINSTAVAVQAGDQFSDIWIAYIRHAKPNN